MENSTNYESSQRWRKRTRIKSVVRRVFNLLFLFIVWFSSSFWTIFFSRFGFLLPFFALSLSLILLCRGLLMLLFSSFFLRFNCVCTSKHTPKLDHFRSKLFSRKSNKRQQPHQRHFCYSLLSNLDFVYTYFTPFFLRSYFGSFSTSFFIFSARADLIVVSKRRFIRKIQVPATLL